MDHGHIDIGGAAFWIFIAVAVWASAWEKSRRNAEKHETLRRIIDKTGVVDEARLKELFDPPPVSDFRARLKELFDPPPVSDFRKSTPSPPGGGYRALRIIGTIVMGIGAALAVLAVLIGQFGPMSAQSGSTIALFVSFAIAFLGLAIFISSRFASPPPDAGGGRDR